MTFSPENTPQPSPARLEAGETTQPGDELPAHLPVRQLLAQDPFLLYLEETGDQYQVRHGTGADLIIPKDRSLPEPYPAERPALLQKAYRWVWLACLGLLLAGLCGMLLATLAMFAALAVNFQPISRADRIRSLVVLLLSGGLWLGGLLLGAILLVHLM